MILMKPFPELGLPKSARLMEAGLLHDIHLLHEMTAPCT